MANSPKRIYWDACTWIALIQRERITDSSGVLIEDRGAMCRGIVNAAFAGAYEIATCSISCVEVWKQPTLEHPKTSQVADFFDHDFILLVSVDREAGLVARQLMSAGYSKLRPMDACHIAAAVLCMAQEMHTFDEKILALDGLIDKPDGSRLRICKPGEGGPPLPLLNGVPPA